MLCDSPFASCGCKYQRTCPSPTADVSVLVEAFRSRRIPVDVEWVDAARAREAYGCAIALVRPDGIVAWRGDTCPVDVELVVDQVIGKIRSRQC